MKRFAQATLALALLVPALPAQSCPSSVQFTPYGLGCSATLLAPPTMTGAFDASTCSLTLTVFAQQTCCNVLIAGRFLVIGTQQVSIPFPLGMGCTILASLDVIVPLAGGSGGVGVTFPLPPAVIGQTVYSQGVVDRFTTIGFTHDFEFTQGCAIDFL